jgi:hypothetical protein
VRFIAGADAAFGHPDAAATPDELYQRQARLRHPVNASSGAPSTSQGQAVTVVPIDWKTSFASVNRLAFVNTTRFQLAAVAVDGESHTVRRGHALADVPGCGFDQFGVLGHGRAGFHDGARSAAGACAGQLVGDFGHGLPYALDFVVVVNSG